MTRAEQAARAAELRATGMLQREIAETMGISRSYVAELVNDPDGAKQAARRERYRGTCETCGAKTSGCNGRGDAPTHCARCFREGRVNPIIRWDRDEIVAAIKRWHKRYGGPPSAWDWHPAAARRNDATDLDRIEMRWESGEWPTVTSVRHYFGRWNDAITAAGFEPRKVGGRGAGDRANRWAA